MDTEVMNRLKSLPKGIRAELFEFIGASARPSQSPREVLDALFTSIALKNEFSDKHPG